MPVYEAGMKFIGKQGKMVPSLSKPLDLLVKWGKKRAPIYFGQIMRSSRDIGFVIGKPKFPSLQESRGEMPVIYNEKINAVFPTEVHHHLGVCSIISPE